MQSRLYLELSLNLSNVLTGYRLRHPFTQKWTSDQAAQIIALKNIVNEQNKVHVTIAMKKLHNWRHSMFVLEARKKTPYDPQITENQEKLMKIWNNLKPKQELKARISTQWIEIGFQAEDPATDFRGTGCLGLDNLYRFSAKYQCKRLFAVAQSSLEGYFFCSASIFLTMLAFDMSKNKLISTQIWNNTQNSPQQQFQKVFGKFWDATEDKSMMQFNSNLKKFAMLIKENVLDQIKSSF